MAESNEQPKAPPKAPAITLYLQTVPRILDLQPSQSGETTVVTVKLPQPCSGTSGEPSKVVVGRVDSADISVMDPLLSRLHFEFTCVEDTWLVRDLNSKNGTALNGEPLPELPQPVAADDIVTAGTSSFRVSID